MIPDPQSCRLQLLQIWLHSPRRTNRQASFQNPPSPLSPSIMRATRLKTLSSISYLLQSNPDLGWSSKTKHQQDTLLFPSEFYRHCPKWHQLDTMYFNGMVFVIWPQRKPDKGKWWPKTDPRQSWSSSPSSIFFWPENGLPFPSFREKGKSTPFRLNDPI